MVQAILFPCRIRYEEGLPLFVRDEREEEAWSALYDCVWDDPMRALQLCSYIAKQQGQEVVDRLIGLVGTLLQNADTRLRSDIVSEAAQDMQLLNLAWAAWPGAEDDPFFQQLAALKPDWAQT